MVRLISNHKYNSSSIIFSKLRVLKLLDIVNFKTAEIVFNTVRNKLPKNIQKHFCIRDKASYKTRKEMTFKVPRCRTQLKTMCVSVRGIKVWDSLDHDIKNSKHIYQFRKLLKNHLKIINYYLNHYQRKRKSVHYDIRHICMYIL